MDNENDRARGGGLLPVSANPSNSRPQDYLEPATNLGVRSLSFSHSIWMQSDLCREEQLSDGTPTKTSTGTTPIKPHRL
ncbi:unnamed protein product [Ilex paraguariensis]|uniref:Uncharacterized protein n=1 Tax=Ilex paraguariensis TaxID=185542 RepID=A0ABC8SWX4_9AQUA